MKLLKQLLLGGFLFCSNLILAVAIAAPKDLPYSCSNFPQPILNALTNAILWESSAFFCDRGTCSSNVANIPVNNEQYDSKLWSLSVTDNNPQVRGAAEMTVLANFLKNNIGSAQYDSSSGVCRIGTKHSPMWAEFWSYPSK